VVLNEVRLNSPKLSHSQERGCYYLLSPRKIKKLGEEIFYKDDVVYVVQMQNMMINPVGFEYLVMF
jgi:hypothetical protein